MATVVELGAVEGFILDDPVAGVLDNTVYTLGGTVFKDISNRVETLSISRGKNRDLDRFNAGALNVILNNDDRAFDPNYASSPFAGAIVPRREVRVTVDGVRTITTTIDDWNYSYTPDGDSRAEIIATDEFTLLARQVLTAGTATPQLSGARVSAVLDMESVDWPTADRVIDTGASTLGADVFSGNALQYLQKVELSEGGLFFIDKQGRVAFKDRLSTPTTDNVTVFSDVAGSGIPFAPALVEYGTEQLYNQITVTSGFGTATANGALSQTRYGILERDVNTLLSSQTQVEDYADFLVGRYDEPEYRFARLAVDMSNLTPAQKAQMFALDMGSVIQINFTPNGLGDPISRYGLVIFLGHSVTADDHIMNVGVGSLQTSLFVLDDVEFGKLSGAGVLAF